ncbi:MULTISPECIES: hypothetical protein [unclassified Nocardioides]|uniref:hypothetical protein n=1 Tax=unclassified Nocardioides TaxID=2615069 RepID=UPI00360D5F38
MKKYLSGLIAAFLMSAGLVAFSGAPVSAADCGTQYQPACVPTKPQAPKTVTVPAGEAPEVPITIRSSGNLKPAGTVTVKLDGKNIPKKLRGEDIDFKVKKGKVVVELPKLKPGKYTFKYTFQPKKGTTFETSKGTITVVVKKKR